MTTLGGCAVRRAAGLEPSASAAAVRPASGSRPPRLGIALIAAAAFGAEMAVSGRYGYVRDELYFLAAGHHLAFGYIDQPPLTPLLARISEAATGNTLVGLRVLPALAMAALDVFRALQEAAGHNRIMYWPAQILYTGPVLTPIWVSGAVWSLRSAAARRFRPVAIACVITIALQFILGGKTYYPGAAFTFLLAAGAVPLERWLAARQPPASRIRPAARVGAAMLIGALVAAPVSLSVLPARALHTVPLQRSITISPRRSPGRSWWRWSRTSTTRCPDRSGSKRRS